MNIYHPALDPYHCAFRILQLLAHEPERQYDRRALRILDFYAVFPHLISKIRLPKEFGRWKRLFSDHDNPYWFSGEPTLVFARMTPLQETALNLLYAQGLLDPQKYSDGQVRLAIGRFQQIKLPVNTSLTGEVLEFLITVLGKLPFHGADGLKDRTHLLEYRYDAA